MEAYFPKHSSYLAFQIKEEENQACFRFLFKFNEQLYFSSFVLSYSSNLFGRELL